MARIRTIKPEFWSSEQVMECSMTARLLFIGMWNFADDAGRHPASPKQLKALIFPGDEISFASIQGMLSELSENGLIRLYDVDEKQFFQITGWHHQRIDKPQKSKFPAPPQSSSESVLGTIPDGKEGKGEDRKGEERKKEAALPRADELEIPADPEPEAENPYDTLLADCAKVLGSQAPADPVIGPIALLIERGAPRGEVLMILRTEAARPRQRPIRTWKLWADIVAERLNDASSRPAPSATSLHQTNERKVDLGGVVWPESSVRKALRRFKNDPHSWPDILGESPGNEYCRVPKYLLEEIAS